MVVYTTAGFLSVVTKVTVGDVTGAKPGGRRVVKMREAVVGPQVTNLVVPASTVDEQYDRVRRFGDFGCMHERGVVMGGKGGV
jgi:hypothetical protein